jgi:penicillin-binding protein 1A
MGRALDGRPQQDFPVPDGIVTARIDPKTGAVVEGEGGVLEPFKVGTEPTATAQARPQVEVHDLFSE